MKFSVRVNVLIVFALALIAGFFPLNANARGFELPPFTNATKLQLNGVWSNVTIKLVLPGSSNPSVKCSVLEVSAQVATYDVVPKPKLPYWHTFVVLAVHDPHANRNCLIRADETFYVSQSSALTGFKFYSTGGYWSHSYVELPDAEGNLETAIAKFEKDFDGRKLNESLLRERHEQVGLQKASPMFYFMEKPVGGANRVNMNLEAFDLTDNILRLDVRNPATRAPASYWIDTENRKVIKSVVDGQEMNVNTSNQPWADPLRK